ncbi:MAG: SpoIIE family protein phosphatase [Acidobacteria bacterium]|nr:SpoIIE family protein phosphatase [Acidobacteriota bacterium]
MRRHPFLYLLFAGMFLYCAGTAIRFTVPESALHQYLTWCGIIVLVPTLPWSFYRLARYLKARIFYKVRNRIVFFYLFAGIIPIGLVLVITLLVISLFLNNLSIIIYQNELKNLTYELRSLNSRMAESLYNNPERAEDPEFLYEKIETVLISEAPELPDVSAMVYSIDENGRMNYHTIVSSYLGWEECQDQYLPDWLQQVSFFDLIIKNYSLFIYAHNCLDLQGRTYYLDLFIPFRQQAFDYLLANSNLRSMVYITERIENEAGDTELTSYVPYNGFRGLAPSPIATRDLRNLFRLFYTQTSDEFAPQADSAISATDWYTRENISASSREIRVIVSMSFRTIVSHLSFNTEREKLLYNALIFFVWFFLIMELVSFVIGMIIIRSVTRSVHQLTTGTRELRKGNLNFVVPVSRNDELGQLSTSFNTMAQSIQSLLNEVADKQRIQRELEIAKDVQRQFFPVRIPQVRGYRLAGRCIPAREVSGDFYDYLQRSPQTLDVLVGDISGKGISAALLMASIQSASRAQPPVLSDNGYVDPQQLSLLIHVLNRHLFSITPPEKFATLFYVRLLTDKHLLQFCNAGHEAPFLFRADGSMHRMSDGGTILGAFPETSFETKELEMQTGDLIVIFTDGLTDAINADGEEYGEKRLTKLLTELRHEEPEIILDRVMTDTRAWFKGVSQHDDMTLVVVRRE